MLVPKERVMNVARRLKKSARYATNPVLMTVTNPPEKNVGGRPGRFRGNPVDIEYSPGEKLFRVHRTNPMAGYHSNAPVPLWNNNPRPGRRTEDDDEGSEGPCCSMCGGPCAVLGQLGNLVHFRCVNCGMQQSKDASECGDIGQGFEENPADIIAPPAIFNDNPGTYCENPNHPFCENPEHQSGFEDNPSRRPVFQIGERVRNKYNTMLGERIYLEKNTLGKVIGHRPFMGDVLYEVQFLTQHSGLKSGKFFAKDLSSAEKLPFKDNPPHYSGPALPNKLRGYAGGGGGGGRGKSAYYGKKGQVDALRKQPVSRGTGRPVRPMKTRKVKIPIAQFEQWLRSHGTKEEWNRYQKEKVAYKKFHKGADPKFITRKIVDVGAGSKVIGRAFGYSMGKSPFEPYITPQGSGKGNKTPYLHEYETMPEGITNSKGKVVIKPLEGRTKITDWIHY